MMIWRLRGSGAKTNVFRPIGRPPTPSTALARLPSEHASASPPALPSEYTKEKRSREGYRRCHRVFTTPLTHRPAHSPAMRLSVQFLFVHTQSPEGCAISCIFWLHVRIILWQCPTL